LASLDAESLPATARRDLLRLLDVAQALEGRHGRMAG
jgi:hypothetical protein